MRKAMRNRGWIFGYISDVRESYSYNPKQSLDNIENMRSKLLQLLNFGICLGQGIVLCEGGEGIMRNCCELTLVVGLVMNSYIPKIHL